MSKHIGAGKVVFTNGCFDVLHRGHVELLKFCKYYKSISFSGHSIYPYVIVGLNSDESVRRLKGESRPVNKQEDRKFLLECLEFVDEVIIFEEDTPYELIKKVKPNTIVKGGDYDNKITDPNDKKYIVGSDLCEAVVFNTVGNHSTTNILKQS